MISSCLKHEFFNDLYPFKTTKHNPKCPLKIINTNNMPYKIKDFSGSKFKISINGLDGLSEINLMSLKLNIWILGSMDKKFNPKKMKGVHYCIKNDNSITMRHLALIVKKNNVYIVNLSQISNTLIYIDDEKYIEKNHYYCSANLMMKVESIVIDENNYNKKIIFSLYYFNIIELEEVFIGFLEAYNTKNDVKLVPKFENQKIMDKLFKEVKIFTKENKFCIKNLKDGKFYFMLNMSLDLNYLFQNLSLDINYFTPKEGLSVLMEENTDYRLKIGDEKIITMKMRLEK